MKKLVSAAFIAAIGILIFASCNKQPTASFVVSDSNPRVGDSIMFYNTAINSEKYEWDFGDGTSSTQINPIHVYYESGTYYVIMTAYSGNRKKISKASAEINVKAAGDVMFWTDASTKYNISVNLQSVGSSTITYYYNDVPDCGAEGCATFTDLQPGVYSFTAHNSLYSWEGTVTVTSGICQTMLLYHAKADKQPHPENYSTVLLTQGAEEGQY